ncbi:EAL domain, c-di-GMP-specific phosphodiesterase class I (or its enzymatically inactive variant) [Geopseudomonas sagittaria]|uniref:EAL domain, c-di-GMP-specific phosphodiesterase class I (Or its enzymatically inactive variant) n=1 Tax=Geopseudomonas sagittaria TaxID=1135990 RepID=A0A1I5QFH2_9GAMM|nr:EAL domain-containing protein [Pseudomonas sagittaria]SFP45049.1 EAL domain, c-di-GMP-specific phosphodiesterase class I (or its enzymatically inactive variant) [Pseudomonas sagittaria]
MDSSFSHDPASDQVLDEMLHDALHAIRKHFGMEVAFISQFELGRRVFRYVDSEVSFSPLHVGGSDSLEDSYCQRVLDGRLPELLHNAQANAEALTLQATRMLPVGAHLSVPIRLAGGETFGTFCCFQRQPDLSLDERDINFMRSYADFVGMVLSRRLVGGALLHTLRARILSVIDGECYSIVYQPIVHVVEHRLVGHEALTRFTAEPARPPDQWFAEAAEVGLQEQLELTVIRKALLNLHRLPGDTYLSLNISPETILKGAVPAVLAGYPLERIVLEITEHASIEDYSLIATELAPLRAKGLRLAVDDAGAGFASFRHIIKLHPDVIKLDISLVRAIDKDLCVRALAAAIIRFAEETNSKVVAEGVETAEELAVLRTLKVSKAQGYLLGRPVPYESLALSGYPPGQPGSLGRSHD